MRSVQVLRVIHLAKKTNRRPSEFVAELDEYTAFCFDEALDYIEYMAEKLQGYDNLSLNGRVDTLYEKYKRGETI